MIGSKGSAVVVSIPAPVGGLNARDAVASMPPTDAIFMQNLFPQDTSVITRKGSVLTNTIPAVNRVESLAVYSGNTVNKLFAGTSAGLYDVTTAGAPSLAYAGISSVFQWCQMGTIGGRFLMLFDGVNNAAYYDGATWTATSFGAGATQIANVDPRNIVNCNIYKNRLYLVEKNSANVWYLPINSIYGAASKLDLSSILKRGSTIISMATWTIDNSAGLQEYAVFISNDGEVVTYSGSDPSSATDFKIAARFNIGRPVGMRCVESVGSDLVIICEDGAFPLSQSLLTDRSQTKLALSDKIREYITRDIYDWFDIYGGSNPNFWSVVLYPAGGKLIINSPYSDVGGTYQYVMNINTGAWTIFSGWRAYCFVRFGSKLYFGSNNGRVYQADTGTDDAGAEIEINCLQSFQYYGSQKEKQFTGIRPVFQMEFTKTRPKMRMDFNFKQNPITPSSLTYSASPSITTSEWQSVSGFGFCGAPRLQFKIGNGISQLQWQATDIMFKIGGNI